MSDSLIHSHSQAIAEKFDAIDQDRNGFLSLLELNEFAKNNHESERFSNAAKFAAKNYLPILNLENDSVRESGLSRSNKLVVDNNIGVSKDDIIALHALSGSDKKAVHSLVMNRSLFPTTNGLLAGFGAGAVTGFVIEASLAVPPLAVAFGACGLGVVAGTAIGHYIGRHRASSYYEQKRSVVHNLKD